MISRIQSKIQRTIRALISKKNLNISYSQSGEDCIIEFLFMMRKISNPTYLELGVYKPKVASNTYKFYKKGSVGVLVEADKDLIKEIMRERPKDKILNVGVGIDDRTEAEFYVFEERAHSTFNKLEAEYREKNGSFKIVKTEKVKLEQLNDIIKTNFKTIPDFLSIDIEGLDWAVLKSLDFKSFPIPIICAETCTYSENHIKPKDSKIQELMEANGYFIYADTYINTIFVNKSWFENT